MKNNDIFISYKRRGYSNYVAPFIHHFLVNKGFSVFLDRKSLGASDYIETIYDNIKNAKDVIVLLEDGALDSILKGDDFTDEDNNIEVVESNLEITESNLEPATKDDSIVNNPLVNIGVLCNAGVGGLGGVVAGAVAKVMMNVADNVKDKVSPAIDNLKDLMNKGKAEFFEKGGDKFIKEIVLAHQLGKNIIPIFLNNYKMPGENDVIDGMVWFTRCNGPSFTPDKDFDTVYSQELVNDRDGKVPFLKSSKSLFR